MSFEQTFMRMDDEIEHLYRKSREAFLVGNTVVARHYYEKLRKEHSIDLYYEVELPPHMMFVHPLGTVLGRATYGDYLAVYQNVGVGSNLDGSRPEFGRGVVLFPGSKVLGRSKIGNNVFVQANTVIHNAEIPDNSIVYPDGRWCAWFPTEKSVMRDFFKIEEGKP